MGTPWDKYSPKKPSHLRKINNQSVVIKGQLGRDSRARANSAGTNYSLERQARLKQFSGHPFQKGQTTRGPS